MSKTIRFASMIPLVTRFKLQIVERWKNALRSWKRFEVLWVELRERGSHSKDSQGVRASLIACYDERTLDIELSYRGVWRVSDLLEPMQANLPTSLPVVRS